MITIVLNIHKSTSYNVSVFMKNRLMGVDPSNLLEEVHLLRVFCRFLSSLGLQTLPDRSFLPSIVAMIAICVCNLCLESVPPCPTGKNHDFVYFVLILVCLETIQVLIVIGDPAKKCHFMI